MPWAADHPHVKCGYYENRLNAIYIAPRPGSKTDRLILNGRDTGLPASGMFSRFDRDLHTLTIAGKTRSRWRLPSWFYRAGEPALGMHKNKERWMATANDPGHVELQSVGRGQEFVFESQDHDEEKVLQWVEGIVRAGQSPKN